MNKQNGISLYLLIFTSLGAAFLPASTANAQEGSGGNDLDSVRSQAVSPSAVLNIGSDLYSGQFTQTVPIEIPAGHDGLQPSFSLQYRSGEGMGLCGVGWSLEGDAYIERDTRKGPPIAWSWNGSRYIALNRYDSSRGFVYSLGGSGGTLVPEDNNGNYRPEIDNGLRFRFDAANNRWEVYDKKGTRFRFGGDSALAGITNRLDHPTFAPNAQGEHTFRWAIESVQDTLGYSMLYFHRIDGTQFLLDRCEYKLSPPGAAAKGYRVSFVYGNPGSAQANSLSYRSGFRIANSKLLYSIETSCLDAGDFFGVIRDYTLSYLISPSTKRPRLYQIDTGNGLAPIQLEYTDLAREFELNSPWTGLSGLTGYAVSAAPRVKNTQSGNESADLVCDLRDFNGDGLPDYSSGVGGGDPLRIRLNRSGPQQLSAFESPVAVNLASVNGNFPSYLQHDNEDSGDIETKSLFADFNGDGYPDRITTNSPSEGNEGPLHVEYHLGRFASGLGFLYGPRNAIAGPVSTDAIQEREGGNTKRLLLDINGDGLPDRISNSDVLLNLGPTTPGGSSQGFAGPFTWNGAPTTFFQQSGGGTDPNVYGYTTTGLYDMNADGLPDLVRSVPSDPDHFEVQFNNGYGFEPVDSVSFPLLGGSDPAQGSAGVQVWSSPAGNYGYRTEVSLLDINGDGTLDRVRRKIGAVQNALEVQLNLGGRFDATLTPFQLPAGASTSGVHPNLATDPLRLGAPSAWDDNGNTHSDFFDIDGDGLPDRVMQAANNSELSVQRNLGPTPDLLRRITSPLGARATVSYLPSTKWNNLATNGVGMLPRTRQTVVGITFENPQGTNTSRAFAYAGGLWDGFRKEFRGFHRIEETDALGVKTVSYFHQGGGLAGEGEFQDNAFAKAGMMFRRDKLGSATPGGPLLLFQQTLQQVEVAERVLTSGSKSYLPFTSTVVEIDAEGNVWPESLPPGAGNVKTRAKRYSFDTQNGNLLAITNCEEITNLQLPSYAFASSPRSTTHFTYDPYFPSSAPGFNPFIVEKPSRMHVLDSSNQLLQETLLSYDVEGRLKSRKVWDNPALNPNANPGNPYLEERFNEVVNTIFRDHIAFDGIKTTVTRDSYSRSEFVSRGVTIAETTQTKFSARTGKPVLSKDHNGLVTRYLYDGFDRLLRKEIGASPVYGNLNNFNPDAQPLSFWIWKEKYEYYLGYQDGRRRVHYFTNDGVAGSVGKEKRIFLDAQGRVIQVAERRHDGFWVIVRSLHDSRGKAVEETLPFLLPISSYPAISVLAWDATRPAVHTEYDALGRPIRVQQPAGDHLSPTGAQTIAYAHPATREPWWELRTNARGHSTLSEKDSAGRMISKREVAGGRSIFQSFDYDALGNLERSAVSDSLQPNPYSITWQHDSLGRKIAVIDPDTGTTRFEYNTRGLLSAQVDSRGNRLEFAYEGVNLLGRMLTKTVFPAAGGAPQVTSYTYDYQIPADPSHPSLIGKLTKVTDSEGWQKLGYDYRGRTIKSTRFVTRDQGTYSLTMNFNDADLVTSTLYPDGRTRIERSYYPGGSLAKISGLSGAGAGEVFYEALQYDEYGRPKALRYGNGVTTNHEFWTNSKRLRSIRTQTRDGIALQSLHYTFDEGSNIRTVSDLVNAGEASLSLDETSYDEIDRLTGYRRGNVWTRFEYDGFGNLKKNEEAGTGIYSYSPSQMHAVLSQNGTNYSYDARGNVQTSGAISFTHDGSNRLTHLRRGSDLLAQFGYAADGARLWKESDGHRTVWIGDSIEMRDGKAMIHLEAGGQRVATIADHSDFSSQFAPPALRGKGIYYAHTDHLGSNNVITDRNGALAQQFRYTPLGRLAYSAEIAGPSIGVRFAGQTFDAETGLYYCKARYYDPRLGRFLQADSIIPDARDAQTLNRYSYSNNNPLKYTDPSGHFAFVPALVFAVLSAAVSGIQAEMHNAGSFGDAFFNALGRNLAVVALTAVFSGVGFDDSPARIAADFVYDVADGKSFRQAGLEALVSHWVSAARGGIPGPSYSSGGSLGDFAKYVLFESLQGAVFGAISNAAYAAIFADFSNYKYGVDRSNSADKAFMKGLIFGAAGGALRGVISASSVNAGMFDKVGGPEQPGSGFSWGIEAQEWAPALQYGFSYLADSLIQAEVQHEVFKDSIDFHIPDDAPPGGGGV